MINKNNNNLVKISISWPILYSIFKLKLMWICYINKLIGISNTIKLNFIIYDNPPGSINIKQIYIFVK